MGILPLQFDEGAGAGSLGLTGREQFDIEGIPDLTPGAMLDVRATADDGTPIEFTAKARIDTTVELEYYRHGGVLNFVLRKFLSES
jgi:aconitate hydratase